MKYIKLFEGFENKSSEQLVSDDNGEIIYNENYLVGGPQFVLNLYDKKGNKIKDLLKR